MKEDDKVSRAKNPKYEIHVAGRIEGKYGKEQTGTGGSNSPQGNEPDAEQQLQQECCAADLYICFAKRQTRDCRSSSKDREGR